MFHSLVAKTTSSMEHTSESCSFADVAGLEVGDEHQRRIPGLAEERASVHRVPEIRHLDHVVACKKTKRTPDYLATSTPDFIQICENILDIKC